MLIGMTKLEHDLRIAHGKAVHVGDTPTQNERVGVERKVGGIEEHNFSDFRSKVGFFVLDEADADLLRRSPNDLAEIAEALHRREAVRLQDELRFQILNPVE